MQTVASSPALQLPPLDTLLSLSHPSIPVFCLAAHAKGLCAAPLKH